MTGVLLDTSVCIDILRGRDQTVRAHLAAEPERVFLSTVALMELAVGPLKRQDIGRADLLDAFLARVEVLDFDEEAARHAADIRAVLERRGTPIGPYDYQICGHARSRGLTVVTRNRQEFERVEGLRVTDWSAPLRSFHE